MKKFILISLVIIPVFSYSQKDSAKLYEPKQIIEDIDSLVSGLFIMHPTFQKHFDEHNLKSKIDSFKNTLNKPLQSIDLFRFMQPIISIDGHTSLLFTDAVYPKYEKRYFPFKVLLYENSLYIKENLSQNSEITKGEIIETINGIPAKQVIDNLVNYVPGEKYLYKIKRLEEIFYTYYFLAYGPSHDFTIKLKNSKETYNVEAVENKKFNQSSGTNFELKFLKNDIAYIYIRKFKQPKEFVHFIDSAFREMQEKKSKYLIIDNTKNSGGLADLGDTIFSYITSKPYLKIENRVSKLGPFVKNFIETENPNGHIKGDYFIYDTTYVTPLERENKFQGTIYFLTSTYTYSAGTFFSAEAKCARLAYIVGEETGQPLVSNGDIDQFKLPNTKMRCVSALSTYYMACSNGSSEKGVIPDYPVKPTLKDLMEDNNYILDYTLKKIRDK